MVGLCLIVGALSLRKAIRWLGYILLLLVAAPFYGLIIRVLPGWLLFVLAVISIWRMFRLVAETLLGRAGAFHMMGILAADAVRGVFRCARILVAYVGEEELKEAPGGTLTGAGNYRRHIFKSGSKNLSAWNWNER
jgi:hypothetical protein